MEIKKEVPKKKRKRRRRCSGAARRRPVGRNGLKAELRTAF